MIEQWTPTRTGRRKRAATPTATQRAKQRAQALAMCQGAANEYSRSIADRLARAWLDCDCDELEQQAVLTPDQVDVGQPS